MEKYKNKLISLLRWSERYTKTDMVYLVKGGSWLGLGQIVSMAAVFLTTIAFANLLPPEIYGTYKYILSITGLILISTLNGIDSAIIQSVARGFEGTLSSGLKTKVKWGVLGSLASLIIAGYYYTQGNMELALAFCIVAILAPFSESLDIYNSFLMGKKLFDVQTKYNVIRKVIVILVLVGILFVTDNIFIILIAYFLTLTVPTGFFLWQTYKKHQTNREKDPEAIAYGKHLSAINVFGVIVAELDKILIFHYLGAVDLAIYALSVAPIDQIKGTFKNLDTLALPQFSNRSAEEIKKSIWHKVGIITLLSAAVVLIYIVLAPWFFELFFPKYLASIKYSQVLALSLIPIIIASLLYTVLQSQKDTPGIYKYNIYTNIFNIVVLVPLVYCAGIWGAIIARIITRIFTFSISIFLTNKVNPS